MNLIYKIDFDIAGLILLILLCIIIQTQRLVLSKTNSRFRQFIYITIFSGVLDIITAFTISNPALLSTFMNSVLNSLYLFTALFSGFMIEHYVYTSICMKSKSHMAADWFVIITYFILLLINLFTGIIFDFNNNTYNKGPLFLLNFILPLFFLMHLVVIEIQNWKFFNRKQLILNSFIIIFPIIASVLQIIFPLYLLTFFSYACFSLILLFSLETTDTAELDLLRNHFEAELAKKSSLLMERQRKIELMSMETTRALANAIDEKDMYTNGHSERVSAYSVMLGQGLGWNIDKVEDLRIAALLHDVGKIGIPDAILKNPNRLSDEEYEVIKTHTVRGGKILHSLTTLPNAESVALYHHERYDGSGYPGKYKGKEIPEFARVVSIADAYDAMNSKRVYRDALPVVEIIKRLKENSGKQFDPDYLQIFLYLIDCGILSNKDTKIVDELDSV